MAHENKLKGTASASVAQQAFPPLPRPIAASNMPLRPTVLPPPPRFVSPDAAVSARVSPAPSIYPGSAAEAGPKQEFARVSMMPAPASASMTPIPRLGARIPSAVTKPATGVDAIPMPLLWAAFVISAVTLLIQIWNYFGS